MAYTKPRWACAWVLAGMLALPPVAWAEDLDTDPQPDELQQEVERTAAEYDEAVAAVQQADDAIAAHDERVAQLQEALPLQQARSDAAARELYKFEQETPGILDFLLSADSFYDFLGNLEYVNRVSEASLAEIDRLNQLKAELDETSAALEQARADADARMKDAENALEAAQMARLEAQRRAEEKARQEAEAAAAAAAALAAAEAEANPTPDEGASQAAASADSASTDAPAPEPEASTSEGTTSAAATVEGDGADWTDDEASFVSGWASRIDAYLAGSPLAGQGATFAQAAWTYGVDPRWSPAIAYTESSLGAACFRPHNAWGWGSESWSSWEAAIDAHVRGLARGYGYTISVDAAKKYCPPNWQTWYDRTLGQMNLI